MNAMVLAAGVGSRLDPLTRNTPKPLVPIVDKPVMEHIIELLKRHGFTNIMVNLHYLGDQIANHFGDGSRLGVHLEYSHEDRLWGDAGSLKRVQSFFKNETFVVMGGDDLTDMDLTRLVRTHREKHAIATLGLSLVDDPAEYGIVALNSDSRIVQFQEKPRGEAFISNMANTGVYVFDPEVFDLIPEGQFYLFGKDLFPKLLQQGRPMYGHLTPSYWRDVGNLDAYRATHRDALSSRVQISFPTREERKFVWIGENVQIDPTAQINYPVVIGNNCRIGPGAQVHEFTVLGNNCAVEEGAVVRESILWDGAVVMSGSWLERCVVGRDCHVQTNAAVFDGVVVSPFRAS